MGRPTSPRAILSLSTHKDAWPNRSPRLRAFPLAETQAGRAEMRHLVAEDASVVSSTCTLPVIRHNAAQ